MFTHPKMGCEATALLRPSRSYKLALLVITIAMAGPAYSGDGKTGTISGRVLNTSNGMYLGKAIVTIEGTDIQVFTNDFGEYSITNAPVGTLKLRVSYTGQETKIIAVEVSADKNTVRDLGIGRSGSTSSDAEATITLDVFKVESNRYKNAQEIAANEERNSVNLKNVVATDSLGFVPDGNVGDFVKFLPGVEVGEGGTYTNSADSSSISVRGFGPENTAIMIDGMPVSSPSPASLSRAVGLDMISINNASRVEVIKVATPDMPSNSPGGAINLITRSAFEFTKPVISFDLTASMNTKELDVFTKSPGPTNKKSYHTLPGARVSVTIPFNKKLGISFSANSDNKFGPNYKAAATYQNANETYDRTVAVANTTGNVSLSNPYQKTISLLNNPWTTYKQSGNLRIDWRPLTGLTITTNYQYSQYTGNNVSRRLQYTAGAPIDWSGDYVVSRPYTPTTTTDPGNKAAMYIEARDKAGSTSTSYARFNYNRGTWQIDGNYSHSLSRGRYDDMENGHFSNIDLTYVPGQVVYRNIVSAIPGSITTYDRNGVQLDNSQLGTWMTASTLNARSGEAFQKDSTDSYALNVRKDLDFLPLDIAVKVGYAGTDKKQQKWGRGTQYQMRYVGPTLTGADLVDQQYGEGPGFGYNTQQWADTYRMYDIYRQHPEYFNANYDVAMQANNYNSATNQTKSVKETTDAYYAQLESTFFNNRVSIIGGARRSSSSIAGMQPYTDSKYNYVKLADGTLYTDSIYVNGVKFDGSVVKIRDASGATVNAAADAVVSDSALVARMKAAGALAPNHVMYGPGGVQGTNSNNLELAMLRNSPRALRRERTDPTTPSISTKYKILSDLIGSISWSRESRLPDLEATGTGGLLAANGSFTINSNVTPGTSPGSEGTITCSNTGLNPETTNSYNLSLSYYTKSGGSFTASYFYKKITNQWEEQEIYNTSPEYSSIIAGLGLDPTAYEDWKISTTVNGLTSSIRRGYELDARQNLGIIGAWGRQFDTFVTYSHKDPTQITYSADVLGQFQPKSRDTYSMGVSFSAKRFTIQMRGLYRQEMYVKSGNTVTYNGLKYQLYNYTPSDFKVNIEIDYRITKNYSVFLSGANIFNTQTKSQIFDPMTRILPVYAYYTSRNDYGMSYIVGVRGVW